MQLMQMMHPSDSLESYVPAKSRAILKWGRPRARSQGSWNRITIMVDGVSDKGLGQDVGPVIIPLMRLP